MMEAPAPKGAARGQNVQAGTGIVLPSPDPKQLTSHTWLVNVEGKTLRIFAPIPATHGEILRELELRFPGAAVRVQAVPS